MNKSISTHIIQLLQITFSCICILLLIDNTFACRYNSKLAFHFYSPSQTHNQDSNIKSQQIIIIGLDNSKLRQKIIKLLQIDNNKRSMISKKELRSWMCKLKLTGFFKSISIKCDEHNKHQIISISLITHPILKNIRFLNLYSKLIPANYVRTIIAQHIGLPINMIDLEESIQSIKLWYINRGYLNVNINIIYNINKNRIDVNIDEYLINKIKIVLIPYSSSLVQFQQVALDHWIEKILSINLNEPLNTKNLDKKLRELNDRNFIQQSYYKIHNNTARELFIYINPVNEHPTYLFGKKNLITSNFVELIETLYNHKLSSFIFHKDFSVFIISKIYNYYCKSIIYNNLTNSIYIDMSQNDFTVLPLYIRTLYFCISQLSSHLHIYDSLLTLNDNFGLRHFIRYFDKYNSNILINITAPKSGPLIDLHYNLPFFYIMEYWTGNLKLYFSNNINLYKKYDRYMTHNYDHNFLIYPKNSLTYHYQLLLNLRHNLYNDTSISNDLLLRQLSNKALLFKNYIRFQKLKYYKLEYCQFTSFLKQKLENCSRFIKYKSNLTIYLNQRKKLLFGPDQYHIEIISLVPNNSIKNYSSFNMHRITHNLSKKIPIRQHYLSFSLRYISWLGHNQFLPFSEKSCIINPDIIRGYTKDQYFIPYQLKSCKLEYYIPQVGERMMYLFVDYLNSIQTVNNNLHRFIGLNSIHIQANPLLKMSYGFGLQIMTPIKQIPPLKLEYGYNINNGQCLHLRVENVK